MGTLGRRFDFNPLPRKEGDVLTFSGCFSAVSYFNPLPRKEGDAKTAVANVSNDLFQSTPS